MPKVLQKQKVSKKGTVVQYGSGSSAGEYFYRELIPGTKNYRTRKIEGATCLEDAVEAAFEIATELAREPDFTAVFNPNGLHSSDSKPSQQRGVINIHRRGRKQTLKLAVNEWLKKQQEQVDVGLLSPRTYKQKRITLTIHLLGYFKSERIEYTNEITTKTFDNYLIYRADTTALNRQKELGIITEWCKKYLVKNRLLDSEVLLDDNFMPKQRINQTDLMKNPAITPEDWKVIVDFVRDEWRFRPLDHHNKNGWYFRNMFWHFILFAKNTGMSPEEILKMKWKQIEIVNERRVNSKGEYVDWHVAYVRTIRAKTKQAREIPAKQATEIQRWKVWVENYIKEKGLRSKDDNFKELVITKDTYVFGNVHNEWTPFNHSWILKNWIAIRDELADKLNGHRFSPHPYTLYSMRSTFIEDHLLKGTPVIEVAEMAGHDVRETQRTYARLNLRKKGTQITLPELGKKPNGGEVVDLFREEKEQ